MLDFSFNLINIKARDPILTQDAIKKYEAWFRVEKLLMESNIEQFD